MREAEDRRDGLDVEKLKNYIQRLSLTIQTLEGEVVDNTFTGALARAQEQHEFTKEKEKFARAQLDFVRSMQAKRNTVLLCVPPPKVSPVDMGTFDQHKSCSACGLLMYDDNALGMFMLPCNHAYHIYCFAHIASNKDTCMVIGCTQGISHTIWSLVLLENNDTCYQRVSQTIRPSGPVTKSDASRSIKIGMYPNLSFDIDLFISFYYLL